MAVATGHTEKTTICIYEGSPTQEKPGISLFKAFRTAWDDDLRVDHLCYGLLVSTCNQVLRQD